MNDTGRQIGGALMRSHTDPRYDAILTPEAVAFVAALNREFASATQALRERRRARQAGLDAGALPEFSDAGADVRAGDWTVAPIPAQLQDRRVEITGPASDRKLVINALNAPVRGYMADLEDSQSPGWQGLLQGQLNLRDAVAGRMEHTDPETGRHYVLGDQPAMVLVRPRGLHLPEPRLRVDDQPAVAGLVDAGLFLFHNARALLDKGSGPYLYLPKLDGRDDACLWNDVLNRVQDELGIPRGTIKVTVLIETLPAAFEMDEILFELRTHAVGLACGRWGYMASAIKTLRGHAGYRWPGRQQLGMDQHFLDSLSKLLCRTCHRRGALAMGGTANWVPVHNDAAANDKALARVRADKRRELDNGHDGTWVAHPGLVDVAAEVFDTLDGPNQLTRALDWEIGADDLLAPAEGDITEADLRNNIGVFVQYLEAWLRGQGALALYNLMEDAATAEICRVQVWHWIAHPEAVLADGREVTAELFEAVLAEELEIIQAEVGEQRYADGRFDEAARLMHTLCTAETCAEFFADAVPLPG